MFVIIVVGSRGPWAALNLRLLANRASAVTIWPKGDSLGQVASVQDQWSAAG